MKRFDRGGSLGALLLGSALLGYVCYELVLWPSAGFPTNDTTVIIAGAPTLRIGHWLKFVDAISLTLLVVALHARLGSDAPLLAQLAAVAGIASATLFLASGMIGVHILAVAEVTFPTNRTEAEITILLRTVTIALFDAAATAAGCWALLMSVAAGQSRRLPHSVWIPGVVFGVLFTLNSLLSEVALIVTVFLAITWAFSLSVVLWRNPRDMVGQLPIQC